MEPTLLDKLTPDNLPVLPPSHPDDADQSANAEAQEDSAVKSGPKFTPPCSE